MRPTKMTAKPKLEGSRSGDYDRFEALAKALVAVPKTEIQAEAEKHEKAKTTHHSA